MISKAGSNGGVTIEGTPAKENVKSLYTENISIADQQEIPVYSSDTDAPSPCFYYNSTDEIYKYKDSIGNVKVAKGATRADLETGGSDQLRLTSQLLVLKEGVTWEIGANRIVQMVLPPNGQIEGTDTIQGDGDLLLFEL